MPSMKDELMGHGFDLKSYKAGNHKTTCPRCGGANKGDMCMSVAISENDNATYSCEHCGWSGSAGAVHKVIAEKPEEYVAPVAPENKPERMPEIAVKFLTEMGITKAVWERNRLFYKEFPSRICMPFYHKGQLFTVKSCKLTEKKFKAQKGPRAIFYGLDDISGYDTAIIVQDEIDKLTLEVCGFINVISIPDSESNGYEYLEHAEEKIRGLKTIILAFDNDRVGKKLQHEFTRRIGPEKCYIAEFPEKNVNKCLIALGVDIVIDCINTAKAYPINGLYEVMDFQTTLMDYFNNQMTRGCSTGFSNLDQFYSVPPGRVTVVTGIPGMGKSEILDAIMWNLSKGDNWNHAVFSPEHGKEGHTTKLIEKVLEIPTDPKSEKRMTESQFIEGACVVHKHFHFIVAEDFDAAPTLDWILEKAKAAVYRYGVKGLLIDPYNEIEHVRNNGETETDYISKLLSKLKKFGKNYGVHVWIVAHPTKIMKDKDGKYLVPTLYDISGSSNWANKADFGLVIHRSESVTHSTEVHIKKVKLKHEGRTGQCNLLYNLETGIYSVPAAGKGKYSQHDEPDEISFDA